MANIIANTAPESSALIRALAAHPDQMADLIEALHHRAQDADDLLDLMGRLSRQAVRLLDGVRWAGVTAQFDDQPFTATHTDDQVLIVDEGQYSAHDGPCLRAMRTNLPVRMTTEAVGTIWPRLGQIAAGVGVRSFLAVPLHADGRSVGALNLYSSREVPPDPDPDLLTVLTEFADRGLTDYQNSRPFPSAEEAVRRALVQWNVIERAVEILVSVNGFTLEYARDVLRDQAEDWGRSLAEQAAFVVTDNSVGD
ncbi:GAF domain-containing protein [Nakamurella sp. UYEF19]|uniref:GAF and ANTAR domain-containing protein n=1 Tax=Nakamurella sp. UYEF19 TaxID=1756392 RepID=UPI0033942721